MLNKMIVLVVASVLLIAGAACASPCESGFAMYGGPCSIGPATFDFNFSSYEESNVDYGNLPAITPINNFPWQAGFSLEGRTIATYPSIYTPGFGFYQLLEFFTLQVPPGFRIIGTDVFITGAQTVGNAEFSSVSASLDSGPVCPFQTSSCVADVSTEVGSAFDQGQIASISWDSAKFLFNARPVPEPASLVLLCTGLASMAVIQRRKKHYLARN